MVNTMLILNDSISVTKTAITSVLYLKPIGF